MLTRPSWRAGLLGLALLVPTTAARAAEVDPLLPNDTQGVLTVNVRQILGSALFKKLDPALLKAQMSNQPLHKHLEKVGFDPFQDLTSVSVVSSGADGPAKGLFIVHGKFDTAKCHAQAEAIAKEMRVTLKTEQVDGHTLYEAVADGQKQTLYVALPDDKTLVAATTKDLALEALGKVGGKGKGAVKSEIKGLIEKTNGGQSFWLATALGGEFAKLPLPIDEKLKDLLEKIQSLSGGVTLADDLKLAFDVGVKTADAAKELAALVQDGAAKGKDLVGVLVQQQEAAVPAAEVLDSVKVSQQGSTVTIKAQLSKQTIDKSLNKGS